MTETDLDQAVNSIKSGDKDKGIELLLEIYKKEPINE